MKPKRYRFQLRVLKWLEAGLPLTRWQQLGLHGHTAWRYRHKLNFRRIWFHFKGVFRIFWKPFTLFRVGGVPVQWHITCAIYPLGLMTSFNSYEHASQVLTLALVIVLLVGGSLLVHEFAHVWTARFFGIGTRRVVFLPFGAVAELESLPRAVGEFWIALAGPLASFALAGIFWLVDWVFRSPGSSWPDYSYPILLVGFVINLALGLFNLLPCFPMDGGRILRSMLAVVIGWFRPQRSASAFLLATLLAVRCVAWPVALGMIALTIMTTHLWLHLILFPLLLLVAELEYWLLRTEDSEEPEDPTD